MKDNSEDKKDKKSKETFVDRYKNRVKNKTTTGIVDLLNQARSGKLSPEAIESLQSPVPILESLQKQTNNPQEEDTVSKTLQNIILFDSNSSVSTRLSKIEYKLSLILDHLGIE